LPEILTLTFRPSTLNFFAFSHSQTLPLHLLAVECEASPLPPPPLPFQIFNSAQKVSSRVCMILILIFAEALGLYGLIVALILSQNSYVCSQDAADDDAN